MTFGPIVPADPSITVSPSNGSAQAALPAYENGAQVMITNAGPDFAYGRFGTSSDATGFPVPQVAVLVMSRRKGQNNIAFYSAGSPTIIVTPGEGF